MREIYLWIFIIVYEIVMLYIYNKIKDNEVDNELKRLENIGKEDGI